MNPKKLTTIAATIIIAATLTINIRTGPAAAAPTSFGPVLYVLAHEDDDVLATGASQIVELAAGHDVYVYMAALGDGTAVTSMLNGTATSSWWGITHIPAAEGYAPLAIGDLTATSWTLSQCGAAADIETARRCEFLRAEAVLGVPASHVRFGNFHDGALQSNQAALQADVLAYADSIAPTGPVHIKGHSWMATSPGGTEIETHPDHLAVGAVIKAIAAADPTRYADPRFFILWSLHPGPWAGLAYGSIWLTTAQQAQLRDAARCYGAWAPPYSYAVGYHSVPAAFDALTANPHSTYYGTTS